MSFGQDVTGYSLGEGLSGDMKFFGGDHTDDKDSMAGLTAFFASPDIPDDYEGGRFHWLELGMYMSLKSPDGAVGALFSGLRHHGGTPPRAPPGKIPDPKAIRFVVVLYPPAVYTRGDAIYNLCAQSNGEPLRFAPEYSDSRLVFSECVLSIVNLRCV